MLAVVVASIGAAGLVGGQFADAVEIIPLGAVFPVLALRRAEVIRLQLGRRLAAAAQLCIGAAVLGGGRLADTGAHLGQLGRGNAEVLLGLQQRVLRQHLLDLLVQLQGGELQEPDRLLQLRR